MPQTTQDKRGVWVLSDGTWSAPSEPEVFSPLRTVSFDGLDNEQAVFGSGSVEGKRWDSVLGNTPYAGGYGMRATTAVAAPGYTSSCHMTIAEGGDGDPSGGDTGVGMGAFGGQITFGADALSEGQEIWVRYMIRLAPDFNWDHGTGTSQPGYIKLIRINNSANGQRLEHHAINGSWDGNAAADNLQIGWSMANEFDAKVQASTHKTTQDILELGTWHYLEIYIKASYDRSIAARRTWIDGQLVFERVGNVNKWVAPNGTLQEETIASGERSLPNDSGSTLTSILLFTYWNGYAPQDNECWLQRVDYHKTAGDLPNVDQYGNPCIGTWS